MFKISRESEINLVNVLIDNDIISGKDLIDIKKVSTENNKSQIDAIFELKLTDEKKIIDLLSTNILYNQSQSILTLSSSSALSETDKYYSGSTKLKFLNPLSN